MYAVDSYSKCTLSLMNNNIKTKTRGDAGYVGGCHADCSFTLESEHRGEFER